MNAQAQRLQDVQSALRERGVVDVKFFFNLAPETAVSLVATDVAGALEDVLAGKYTDIAGIGDRVAA